MDTAVRSYRTDVVIPDDRVLLIHLPDDLPVGRAVVIVQAMGGDGLETDGDDLAAALDLDRADMEWWDEFESDDAR
jgi:hypothetical protein